MIKLKGLFLDDERFPQDVTWIQYPEDVEWTVVRSFQDFSLELAHGDSDYQVYSFDHDIQSYDEHGDVLTSDDCVKVLFKRILEQQWNPQDLDFIVHSQNPNDRVHIENYIHDFMRHCS